MKKLDICEKVHYNRERDRKREARNMVAESIAILAVCGLLVISFMRSRFAKGSLLVLPVAVLPAMHLLVRGILYFTKGFLFGARGVIAVAFVDVIALGISCAIIIVLGRHMKSQKPRRVYYVFMVSYCVVVGWVYIYSTLKPLLR